MDLVVCIRKSENWQALKIDDLWKNRGKTFNCSLETIIYSIKIWDRILSMPYFELRHRLKQITLQNIRDVKFATLHETQSDPDLDYLRSLKDTFIIINDDDDYLHPNFYSKLQQYEGKAEFILWDSIVNTSYPKQTFSGWNSDNKNPGSNNYAIHSSVLSKFNDEELFDIIHRHVQCKENAQKKNLKIVEVDDYWSCYNCYYGGCWLLSHNNGFSSFNGQFLSCYQIREHIKFPELNVFSYYINEFYQVLNEITPKFELKF